MKPKQAQNKSNSTLIPYMYTLPEDEGLLGESLPLAIKPDKDGSTVFLAQTEKINK